mmetsp:Transcript_14964/g.30569  ORF Transcript_14964/g.30569 Transcript_14964/m.30569 type:complete len:371 (-) Transcript_14964:319-1431(-)
MLLPRQLFTLASVAHNACILSFGYFIPALSSVKAVVRKDPEAYHQWTTYWLILHLYLTIISPILHITLHPLFRLLVILWLSLPQYQGASVVYERLIVPWVDKYEERVDDAVDEAHRGVRRWIFARMGRLMWLLMGEGGNAVGGLMEGVIGLLTGSSESFRVNGTAAKAQTTEIFLKSSMSSESLLPRHSMREAISENSSMEEIVDAEYNNESLEIFVRDFIAILHQGLYVFANVDTVDATGDGDSNRKREKIRHSIFDGGFKLGIFSFHGHCSLEAIREGIFLVSPVVGGSQPTVGGEATGNVKAVEVPIGTVISLMASGSQGLLLECVYLPSDDAANSPAQNIRLEIVMSDESDRDILLSGLKKCLHWL